MFFKGLKFGFGRSSEYKIVLYLTRVFKERGGREVGGVVKDILPKGGRKRVSKLRKSLRKGGGIIGVKSTVLKKIQKRIFTYTSFKSYWGRCLRVLKSIFSKFTKSGGV